MEQLYNLYPTNNSRRGILGGSAYLRCTYFGAARAGGRHPAVAAVADHDAAFRGSLAAELQRMSHMLLQAAELALPALAAPQELNIGACPGSLPRHGVSLPRSLLPPLMTPTVTQRCQHSVSHMCEDRGPWSITDAVHTKQPRRFHVLSDSRAHVLLVRVHVKAQEMCWQMTTKVSSHSRGKLTRTARVLRRHVRR